MSPVAGSADAAVGMMDSAYFTGRRELLEFFNTLLDLDLQKIEQTASGAVACQLTEYIFPGSIPMSRVKWDAKTDFEFVQNYKLLQQAFTKNRVQRHVDVDKLIRAKYQDNLEFCQWLKAFYDQAGVHRPDYDPVAVRSKGKGGNNMAGKGTGGTRPRPKPNTARSAPVVSSKPVNKPSSARPLRERPAGGPGQSQSNVKKADAVVADATLMKKNAELTAKLTEMEQTVVEIEKERDFYFQKLRDIEVMLQVYQEKEEEKDSPDVLINKLFKVLYATAEEGITVSDDGEIIDAAEQELENALFEE